MSQLAKWIICFIVFALFGWIGLYHSLPGSIKSVTNNLDTIANNALAKSGQSGWAEVSMDGQRAIVVGEAPSEEARNRAIISIRRASGAEGPIFGGVTVALADNINIASPFPTESPYRFSVDYQGGYIRVSEAIPSALAQIELNNYVSQLFPEPEFFDNTRIALGVPNEQWIEAIKTSLLSLSSLDEGQVIIEDLEINLNGNTTSQEQAELAIVRAQQIPAPYTVSGEINLNGKPVLLMIKGTGETSDPLEVDNSSTENEFDLEDDLDTLSFEKNQRQDDTNNDSAIDQTNSSFPSEINQSNGNASIDITENPRGVINIPAPSKTIKKSPIPKKMDIETEKGLPAAPEPLVSDSVGEIKDTLSSSNNQNSIRARGISDNISFDEEKNIPELIGDENNSRSIIENSNKARQENLPSIPTRTINEQNSAVSNAGIAVIGSKLYTKPSRGRETATQRYARDCVNSLALLSNHQSIRFGSGSDSVLPISRPTLAALAHTLLSCEQYTFTVEAHTADTASTAANLLLSQKRAKMVRNFLISRGVKPTIIKEIGYGASRPIADNSTLAGRSNNDRINIILDIKRN